MCETLFRNLFTAAEAITPLAFLDPLERGKDPLALSLAATLLRLRHRLLLERIHPREPSDAVLLQLDSVARIRIGTRFAIERRKPCIQGRTSVLVGHLNRADGCDR